MLIDASGLQKLLGPLSQAITDAKEFKEKNRTSKQINHLSTVAEGISVLAFVAVMPSFVDCLILFRNLFLFHLLTIPEVRDFWNVLIFERI